MNVSSALTRICFPGYAAYACVKGAVDVLTRYMAKELRGRGITVKPRSAPGAIETDFSGGGARDNADINKLLADATALGRVGLPDDIGPMIASLLSGDNRWVNAQWIEVVRRPKHLSDQSSTLLASNISLVTHNVSPGAGRACAAPREQ